eukprot:3011759-Rhodomonas_salina.1
MWSVTGVSVRAWDLVVKGHSALSRSGSSRETERYACHVSAGPDKRWGPVRSGVSRSKRWVLDQLAGRPYTYQLPTDRPELGPCPLCGLPFVRGDERVKSYVNYATAKSKTAWLHVFCAHYVFNNEPWGK